MKSLRPTHPTMPVLAKGKPDKARCWIYVRDDRPFGGAGPPTAMFYYSRDRRGELPRRIWPGMPASCRPTPVTGTTSSIWRDATLDRSGKRPCWVHARRPFFAMADIEENARRKATGKKEIPLCPSRSRPCGGSTPVRDRALHQWQEPRRASGDATDAEPASGRGLAGLYAGAARQALPSARLAKAFNYILKRWASLTLFLEDGRACLSNNAAERGLRGIAMHNHYATPLQVSVNIGSVLSSEARHGRPFRAIAAFTASVARSDAQIWKGAPRTPARREGYSP